MIMMIKILGIDDFSEIYNKRLVNDFPESEVKSLKKIIDMYKKDMYFVYGYYNEMVSLQDMLSLLMTEQKIPFFLIILQ